jgi:glutaconate CoA-transferase subunit B
MDADFSLLELMTVAAASEIRDGERVIAGTGLPLLAALLAQKTHAPNMIMIYETGTIDAEPAITPFSVADPALVPGAAMQGGLLEGLGPVHAGEIDLGFLSGARIDCDGNLNSHVIGGYHAPQVRLAGSGGANDIGLGCGRTIIMMPHQKQRFPERVDFISTPGHLTGGDARRNPGWRRSGPSVVVSTLGVMRFDPTTKEMILESCHPGVSLESIRQNTGWAMKSSVNLTETA